MKEENGHDKILNVALKAFTADPDAVPVSLQTKAIMHLLKFAAQRNFLAFAMAVDFFERSSYEKTDPLAQLLIKGGFDKAAKQINRHMEINDAGGHENVACSFLEAMGPCEPAYAFEAMRIAEMLVKFPQACMNRDRNSCYFAAYEASSFEDALGYEYSHGIGVVEEEGLDGAKRFAAGHGRAGKL